MNWKTEGVSADGWRTDVAAALAEAAAEKRAVLLDFWGMSCKNCVMMDKTTLKDRDVAEWFEKNKVVLLKVQGDNEADADAQALMKRHQVIGFPTYVLLLPNR